MLFTFKNSSERISEYRNCLFKGNAMLCLVCFRLSGIPFKLKSHPAEMVSRHQFHFTPQNGPVNTAKFLVSEEFSIIVRYLGSVSQTDEYCIPGYNPCSFRASLRDTDEAGQLRSRTNLARAAARRSFARRALRGPGSAAGHFFYAAQRNTGAVHTRHR